VKTKFNCLDTAKEYFQSNNYEIWLYNGLFLYTNIGYYGLSDGELKELTDNEYALRQASGTFCYIDSQQIGVVKTDTLNYTKKFKVRVKKEPEPAPKKKRGRPKKEVITFNKKENNHGSKNSSK